MYFNSENDETLKDYEWVSGDLRCPRGIKVSDIDGPEVKWSGFRPKVH